MFIRVLVALEHTLIDGGGGGGDRSHPSFVGM